jgi:antitoxin component YwqK of YwqJK toxin-antitoxin module
MRILNRCKLLILFFSLLILSSKSSFAQNVTDANGKKQGVWAKKDSKGILKYKGQFKDDIPFGNFLYYYENGNVKSEMYFFENGLKAKGKIYTTDNVLEAEGNYYNKEKDSIWLYYDIEGKKVLLKEGYIKGKKEGEVLIYNDKGKLLELQTWKNDVRDGKWNTFFENGNLKIDAFFKNANLDSTYNVFTFSGVRIVEGLYRNNGRYGNWFYYHDTGQMKKQEVYKDKKLIKAIYHNGQFDAKYDDDKPKCSYTYKDKQKNGPFIEYYDNGKYKIIQKPNEEGQMEDVEILEGQTVKTKGNYKNDKLVGKVFYYDENGKVSKEENYDENGNLLNKK